MKKKFDCVEMTRQIKANHAKEIQELGLDEWIRRMKERLAKDPLWRRFAKRAVAR